MGFAKQFAARSFKSFAGPHEEPTLLIKQTTLAAAVETDGIGLHTAVPVHVRLAPAPPDTGYVFRRTDLGGFEIPATVESVAHCGYATTLMRTGVMLSTVEHLLSALRGLSVDNVYIEVDNLEVPILDGSAEVFAEMLESAGIVSQRLARRGLAGRGGDPGCAQAVRVRVRADGAFRAAHPDWQREADRLIEAVAPVLRGEDGLDLVVAGH
jgi:UDP-3-O-[3-hydroxymyristoyl] N-acetylglucosamine deacetylase